MSDSHDDNTGLLIDTTESLTNHQINELLAWSINARGLAGAVALKVSTGYQNTGKSYLLLKPKPNITNKLPRSYAARLRVLIGMEEAEKCPATPMATSQDQGPDAGTTATGCADAEQGS